MLERRRGGFKQRELLVHYELLTSDFWRYISSLDSGSGSARLSTNLQKKLRELTVATAWYTFCGRCFGARDAGSRKVSLCPRRRRPWELAVLRLRTRYKCVIAHLPARKGGRLKM